MQILATPGGVTSGPAVGDYDHSLHVVIYAPSFAIDEDGDGKAYVYLDGKFGGAEFVLKASTNYRSKAQLPYCHSIAWYCIVMGLQICRYYPVTGSGLDVEVLLLVTESFALDEQGFLGKALLTTPSGRGRTGQNQQQRIKCPLLLEVIIRFT